MKRFATLTGTVIFTADAVPCIFTGPIDVEQVRDDTDAGTVSSDFSVEFNRDLYDAITNRVRWTGSRLYFDGDEIVLGRGVTLSVDESFPGPESNNGEQTSLRFTTVGDLWAVPSSDPEPVDNSTCPVAHHAHVRTSPRSIGNKHTRLDLLLGVSPKWMRSRRMFQGMSFQKPNKGDILVGGEITCVDDSSLYVNKPFCFSLAPFSGLRRDEIVRLMAGTIGLNPAEPGSPTFGHSGEGGQVRCPIGKVYNKAILVTNASFMAFLNEFIAPELWYASFDEFGILNVREIQRKDAPDQPDWILDASLGDYDYDSFEEDPPAAPPTKIVVTVAKPVSGTGPDGANLTQVTRTTVEEQDMYAPRCVKVRPSGLSSHLFGDGSYRTLAAEELMTVSRVVTDITTVNGQEVRRYVQTFSMYNPAAYDPNFTVYPNTTLYDGAYGDKSFHRDEAESLMVTSETSLETIRDLYGTILGTVETTKGWYAPHRGLTFNGSSRTQILGDAGATPPSYIYGGGTSRILPAEVYGLTVKIEKSYSYASDGTLATIDETRTEYISPLARCDITVNDNPEIPPIPENPPVDNPPPAPPPEQRTPWWPNITGPISQNGNVFTFLCSIAGAYPGSVPPNSNLQVQVKASTQAIPVHGPVNGVSITNSAPFVLNPGTNEQAYVQVTIHGAKPAGLVVARFSITYVADGFTHGDSNNLVFDPWQGLPPGTEL